MSKKVSNQLFRAVKKAVESGWSLNQIAKSAGVPQPSLNRWYSDERKSLALKTVTALCEFFQMELTEATIEPPPADVQEPRRKPKVKEAKKK